VLLGVSESDKEILDIFEGDEYELKLEEIVAESGRISCHLYVYKPKYYWRIHNILWSPEAVSKKDILRRYCGE